MKTSSCAAGFGLLLASAAVLAVALPAAAPAADLPSRRAPPVYAPPAPVAYSWTGFEFGLTTSVSIPNGQGVTTVPFGRAAAPPTGISLNKGGFDDVGGGVAANYQLTRGSGVVIGAAVDVDYFNLHAFNDTFVGTTRFNAQERLAYLGTANGRIGYGFDRLLLYVTGGYAFGEVHNSAFVDLGTGAGYFGTNGGPIRSGFDIGAGGEYAIPPDSFLNKLSVEKLLGIDKKLGLDVFDGTLRVEYIHYDLGRETITANGFGGAPGGYTSSIRTEGSLVRVGLGYKFNGFSAPTPVVARY